MDLYTGKMLDNRYELLEVVGTGGMAVVYKAKCHRLNRFVAVKILKPEAAADPELRRRFHDESQAVAMLTHPNIVSVFDVSKTDELEYIVMELIDGITLKQYMKTKGGRLPWKEALHFITQIMRALRHAHGRGIIHRDIKPHNVMVLRDGSAKVTDFGIAHLTDSQDNTRQEALGSVHYISPEQASGAKVDARSDIYSAGVVLYEMLTGQLPYEGETPVAIALQHINSTPIAPRELYPNIPKGLEQITLKAMASKPADRYESARAMLVDLDAFRQNPALVFDYSKPKPVQRKPLPVDEPDVDVDDDATRVVRSGATPRTEPPRVRPAHRTEYSGSTEADPPRRMSRVEAREAEANRKQKQKQQNNILIIAAIAILILIIVLAGLFFRRSLNKGSVDDSSSISAVETTVTVPSITGMQLEAAKQRYGDTFDIQVVSYTEDASAEDGAILTQDPEYGGIATVSGTEKPVISVTVATVPITVSMPALYMYSKEAAIAILKDAGITEDQIQCVDGDYSSAVKAGSVLSTDPAEGTGVKSTDTVTLYLSKGTEPVTMPNFVGELRTVVEASLKSLGLTGTFTEVENEAEAGTILSQSIPAGEAADYGTTVEFTYSSGPAEPEATPTPSASPTPSTSTWESPTPSASTEPSPSPSASTSPAASTSPTPAASTDSQSAANTGNESTGGGESGVVSNQTISVALPSSSDTCNVQVTVDGASQYARDVDTAAGSINVTLSGSGTENVSVYVDGVLTNSYDVNFG